MDREKFIKKYIGRARDDKEVKLEFEGLDEKGTKEAQAQLESFLDSAYTDRAKNYFENHDLGRYVSTFLRASGGVMNGLGSYFFWAAAGSGLGLKAVGFLENMVADKIDYKRDKKYLDIDLSDKVKLGAETVAERAAAYLPLFAGEIADLLRGRSKHDNLVLEKTTDYGVERFLDYRRRLKENPDYANIIPVEYFRNPAYAEEEKGKGPEIIEIKDYKSKTEQEAEEPAGPEIIQISTSKAKDRKKAA
jgi:hypothetical protein